MSDNVVEVTRGARKVIRIDLSAFSPEDVSGWSLRIAAKTNSGSVPTGSEIAVTVKETGDGITIDGAEYLAEVTYTPTETLAMTAGEFLYDVWRTDASSQFQMVKNARFAVKQGVQDGT